MLKTNPPSGQPRLRRKGLFQELIRTAVFLAAVYTLLEMTIPRSAVLSISMQPTLVAEQRLLISRVSYLFAEPHRGDIVVFTPPNHPPDDPPLIKRLIGLPGETLEFRGTYLFVNGLRVEEPYLNEPCTTNACPNRFWQLGADEYFFMGDNRNHSRDSRSFGPIRRPQLFGRAILRWWPPANWSVLSYNYDDPNP